MRLLFITSLFHPDNVGGAELLVEELGARLVELGHEVGVICTSQDPAPAQPYRGMTVFRVGHTTPFFIKEWSNRSKLERVKYKLSLQLDQVLSRRIAAVAAAFAPDIINTHSLSELPASLWNHLATLRAPLIHTLHDFISLCTNGAMYARGAACLKPELKCEIYSLPYRQASRHVSGVISVGEDTLRRHRQAGFFRNAAPDNTSVIWNPIEMAVVSPRPAPPPGRDLVLGYLGRIEPAKGVDTFIEALKRLPLGGWSAVIAGRAADGIDSYVRLAEGLPVSLPGFVERESFFAGIDCLVVPAEWPESFGRTVSEAILMGIPVIASDIGGLGEQMRYAGLPHLFAPGDSHELAGRLAGYLARPEDYLIQPDMQARIADRVDPRVVAAAYEACFARFIARQAA